MIIIRKQTSADTKDVQLIRSIVTDELRSIYRPIKTKTHKEKTTPTHLVAIVNNKIVGTADFFLYKDNALVQNLAILPEYRKQGIAKKIIDFITSKVKTKGKHELLLSTVKETGNTGIFLKMGFTVLSEDTSDVLESAQGYKVTIVNLHKKLNNR